MMARLMVYLGTDVDRARQLVAQAGGTRRGRRRRAQAHDHLRGPRPGRVADGRRVLRPRLAAVWALALDSGGFAVDDRDRSAGDYFVRYMDTDTGEKREDPTIFGRALRRQEGRRAQYRVHLLGTGRTDADHRCWTPTASADSSPTAQRMLNVPEGQDVGETTSPRTQRAAATQKTAWRGNPPGLFHGRWRPIASRPVRA